LLIIAAGHSAGVEESELNGPILIVNWRYSDTGGATSLALSSPYHIVKVRRSKLSIHFNADLK
jgi:hypothetical protein